MRWEDRVFEKRGTDVRVCLGTIGATSEGTWTVLCCKNEKAAEMLLEQLKQAVTDIYTF